MGNRNIILVALYCFFQYSVYDLVGEWENSFDSLYYWGVPVCFMLYILYLELNRPIKLISKIIVIGLAIVLLYHYLRLVRFYEDDWFVFMSKLEHSKPVYNTTIVYIIICILIEVYNKFKLVINRKLLNIYNLLSKIFIRFMSITHKSSMYRKLKHLLSLLYYLKNYYVKKRKTDSYNNSIDY